MKSFILSILASSVAFSAFADAPKLLWLTKPVSVETDAGIHGYVVGTPVFQEGAKYKVGSDLIILSAEFITDDFETVRPIVVQANFRKVVAKQMAASATPAPKPVEAPKAVPVAPRPLTAAQGGLQMSGGLDMGGTGGKGYGKTTRGFYVNADGTLGNRVGK